MILVFVLYALFQFFSPTEAGAIDQKQTPLQTAMIQDLEVAKYSFSVRYAPGEWKQELFGWNLDDAFEAAKTRILEEKPKTSHEYGKIFRDFLHSTKDYHVRSMFYSTELAIFPFIVKSAEGRYFITEFNVSVFPELLMFFDCDEIAQEQFAENFEGIEVGDELIGINGVSASKLIERIVDEELGGDRTPTGYALAERMLFCRQGIYGETVPSGTFEVDLRHQGERDTFKRTLPWFHIPEWVMNRAPKVKLAEKGLPDSPMASSMASPMARFLNRDFSVAFAKDLLDHTSLKFLSFEGDDTEDDTEEDSEEDDDIRFKGFLPELGEVVWETEGEDLYAYLYVNDEGQRIGYMYLPDFAWDMSEEISDVLQSFEEESEALVLDITNNPGGYLEYVYGLSSMLTDQPLVVPTHQERLVQADIFDAALTYVDCKNVLDNYDDENDDFYYGYPINKLFYEQMLSYSQQIIQSWESGKTLTDPLFVLGINEILPHPDTQYTKPILLLTNELDFSGGDFFPAILQDNGRAVLFGKRTAGAGGYVLAQPHMSQFGVLMYSLTGSIAYRPDGKPIENLGVTPDIPYELTVQDLQENYFDYVREVNATVSGLVE